MNQNHEATLITRLKVDTTGASELIKNRWLCQGGSVIFSGYAGQGKSSLLVQLAMHWSLNRECLGFVPTRKLSSLIIQAENDDEDMIEMRNGCLHGMNLTAEQWEQDAAPIHIVRVYDKVGVQFASTLRTLIVKFKPDIVWIDPALAFLGGDVKEATDVGRFCRCCLQPIQVEFKVAIIVATHMNKPLKDHVKTSLDLLYAATGSIEWTNWARASFVLNPGADSFTLYAAKRGERLGWISLEGTPVREKYIEHADDGTIWWQYAGDGLSTTAGRPKAHSPAKIVDLMPADGPGWTHKEWLTAAAGAEVAKRTFERLRRLALDQKVVVKVDDRYRRCPPKTANGHA